MGFDIIYFKAIAHILTAQTLTESTLSNIVNCNIYVHTAAPHVTVLQLYRTCSCGYKLVVLQCESVTI